MIEQETDGMWAVDGYSEPMTDWDYEEDFTFFENNS